MNAEQNDILAAFDKAQKTFHRAIEALTEAGRKAESPLLALVVELLGSLFENIDLSHAKERKMWQDALHSARQTLADAAVQGARTLLQAKTKEFLQKPLWILFVTNDEKGIKFPLGLLPEGDGRGSRFSWDDQAIHESLLWSGTARYLEEILECEQGLLLDRDYWGDGDEKKGILSRVWRRMDDDDWPSEDKKAAFFSSLRRLSDLPQTNAWAKEAAQVILASVPPYLLLEILPASLSRLSFSWEEEGEPSPLPLLLPATALLLPSEEEPDSP